MVLAVGAAGMEKMGKMGNYTRECRRGTSGGGQVAKLLERAGKAAARSMGRVKVTARRRAAGGAARPGARATTATAMGAGTVKKVIMKTRVLQNQADPGKRARAAAAARAADRQQQQQLLPALQQREVSARATLAPTARGVTLLVTPPRAS